MVADYISENIMKTRIGTESTRLIELYKNLISRKYGEIRDEAQTAAREDL